MRRERMLGFGAVCGFALLVATGIAAAQADSPQQAPPPPDANAGLGRQVTLSPSEQLSQSEVFLNRMDNARLIVRRLLEQARTQRDVVKTLCLNDKLNQIDVAIRSARERKQSLELAAKRSDADLSTHEFTILSVLRQRVEQLSAEANQCIGKEVDVLGESAAVTTQIDPTIPDEKADHRPPLVIVEPPPSSSLIK
jgi:hypothetical protein